MATHFGIAGVSEALRTLLQDSCPRSEFPDAQFELYQTGDFQKPMTDGVSIYLWRIAVNTNMRNLPPRVDLDGRRYRPSLPLDLFYALGAWGRTALQQQRLLGWLMRTLEDLPILASGLLNHQLPEVDTFRASETVEFVCDPLNVQDLSTLWDLFKPNVPLFATYVARLVTIDSTIEIVRARDVQTRVFEGAGR